MVSEVTVKLHVDDKGTLKAVTAKAKELNTALNNTAKGAYTTDRNIKGSARASSNATKNFSKMAQGITGGLVPAYAVLAANIFALSAAFNFLKNAADLKILEQSQQSFAGTSGRALQSMTRRLIEASGGLLSFQEAAEASAIGAAKGFSTSQIEDFAVGARKAAAALGRDYTDAFSRILRGVSKAEPELLDELGITLRLEEATRRYALTLNKTAKDLTTYEKSQAVAVETQRQLNEMFGDIDVDTNDFVKLQKTFTELIRSITQKILPAFQVFVDILNRSALAAIAFFGTIGLSIIKAALPWEEMSESFTNFRLNAAKGLRAAKTDLRAYNRELQLTKQSAVELAATNENKARSQAFKFVAKGSNSSLLEGIAGDREIGTFEKKALSNAFASAERQVKIHGEIVTGIFKGQSIKRVRDFKTALAAMEKTSFTTFEKVKNHMRSMVLTAKVTTTQLRVLFSAAFGFIGAAATRMGMAVNLALKATGAIAILVFLVQILETIEANIADIAAKIPLLNGMEGVMASFQEMQDEARKSRDLKDIFAGISDSIRTAEKDLQNMLVTLRKASTPVDMRAAIRMEAIPGLGLSDILDPIRSNLSQEGGAEKFKEFRKLLETMGEVFPQIAAIKNLPIELLGPALEATEERARLASTSMGEFRDQLGEVDKILTNLSGRSGLVDAEVFFDNLAKSALRADQQVTSFGETLQKSNQQVLKDSGFDVLLSDLQEMTKESRDLDAMRSRIDISEAKLADFGSVRAGQGALNIASRKASLELLEAELDLKTASFLLDNAQTDAQRIVQTEAKLKAQQEVSVLEERSKQAKIAASEIGQIGKAFNDSFEDGFVGAMDSVIQGTTSVKDAFKNMAKSILESLSQVIAKLLVMKILGGLPGVTATTTATPVNTPLGAAAGYATGGIARGPKSGFPTTLHGTEAIVPLPNGRSIPVEMSKGAGATNNVEVNVNIDNAGKATATSTSSSNSVENMGKLIARAVQKELQNQKRSGGILNPYGVA